MVGPNHTHSTSLIGRPIHFGDGQFAGQTIRAELHEVQKADLGRKWVLVDFFYPCIYPLNIIYNCERYARVDRRPLDPPPAVLLRLFHVYNAGTERECEKEVRNYEYVLNFLCTG